MVSCFVSSCCVVIPRYVKVNSCRQKLNSVRTKGKHIWRLKLSFAAFLKPLLKCKRKEIQRCSRREIPWVGGEQHVVKSSMSASVCPLVRTISSTETQQDLSENKFSSGNEGAVCSERRQRTFSTFKSPLFTPGPPLISWASAEILPCRSSSRARLKVNPPNRGGTTPA